MKANREQTGVVFNIQKFSVNDGPGIRTVVFFKGCPLRCQWCSNPESQSTKVQILWDTKKCVHCLHCIDTCKQNAVKEVNNEIHIDCKACIGCLECEQECPQNALKHEGDTKTVQQVLNIVKQDEVFYEESGGGITLSGGELLMQSEFACELLKACKEENIHTACETTGFASPEVFLKVIENIDYVLFDMKHWDTQKHKEYTGVENTLIKENIKQAIASGKTVLPRIPVIPGFNDSLHDAEMFSQQFKELGIQRVQLLPFHQFGENKYSLLNKEYAYRNTTALHKEDLIPYQNIFLAHGIEAFF